MLITFGTEQLTVQSVYTNDQMRLNAFRRLSAKIWLTNSYQLAVTEKTNKCF